MYEIRSVPEAEALALQKRLSTPDCDPETGRHHVEHLASRLGAWSGDGDLVGLVRLLPLNEQRERDEGVLRLDGPYTLAGHRACREPLLAAARAAAPSGIRLWQPVDYSAADIVVLSGSQAVRKRPGMYIGSVDAAGEAELVFEPVSNTLDEHAAGFATALAVSHDPAQQMWTVSDDGRGIPFDVIEKVVTLLRAGPHQGAPRYHIHAGLHGLGMAVLSALSERCTVESEREGRRVRMGFSRGEKVEDLTTIPATGQRGTTVRFRLDTEIFSELRLTAAQPAFRHRLWELACFNPGLRVSLQGAVLDAAGGLLALAEHHAGEPLVDVVRISRVVDGVRVSGVLGWRASRAGAPLEVGYCNQSHTTEGGTHLAGARAALRGQPAAGRVLLLNVDVVDVWFEGRTRQKLGNPGVEPLVAQVLREALP